ncbi:MAG: hypothetical protein ACR2LM_07940 [Pyrinomonadaceae bacterium]
MTEKIDQDFASQDAGAGLWRRRWMRLALIWGNLDLYRNRFYPAELFHILPLGKARTAV